MRSIILAILIATLFHSSVLAKDGIKFNPVPVGVYSEPLGNDLPVGSIIIWNSYGMPSNGKWRECNGQSVPGTATEYISRFGWYTPNYQGMFLRGYGWQNNWQNNGSTVGWTETWHGSGNLNELQGDAVRNVYGFWDGYKNSWWGRTQYEYGALRSEQGSNYGHNGGQSGISARIVFDASRQVPTAPENRPANKAVKYIIKII